MKEQTCMRYGVWKKDTSQLFTDILQYKTEVKWGSASSCPSTRDIDNDSLEFFFIKLDFFCLKLCLVSKI
jgi:hypothetical protein